MTFDFGNFGVSASDRSSKRTTESKKVTFESLPKYWRDSIDSAFKGRNNKLVRVTTYATNNAKEKGDDLIYEGRLMFANASIPLHADEGIDVSDISNKDQIDFSFVCESEQKGKEILLEWISEFEKNDMLRTMVANYLNSDNFKVKTFDKDSLKEVLS